MPNYDEPISNYNREIIVTQPNKNKPAHIINIRESSIETMYYRKHITAMQYAAGSIFRRKFEMSQLISKPEISVKVDVSTRPSIADSKLDAIDDLNKLHATVGQHNYELVEYVCGFGNTIKELCIKFRLSKGKGGPKFREALDEVAIYYGLLDKGNTIRGNKKR